MPKKQGSLLPVLGLEVDKPSEYISERSSLNNSNVELGRMTVKKRVGTAAFGDPMASGELMTGFQFEREGAYYLVRISTTNLELWA